jgi:hypothetical protein
MMLKGRVTAKTVMLYERLTDGTKREVGSVTVAAEQVVIAKVSQYADLRDAAGTTFATLTWPSKYEVREL